MGLIVSGCTITAELKEKLSSLLDNKSPEVVLSSAVQGYSNQPSWLVDLHSSEELLNLEASDLIVVNGVIGSLTQVSEKHWQLQVHPAVDGLVTIHLPENTAEGRYTAKANLASNQISIVSDRTKPGVTLGYPGADPTNVSPIVVNVIFDEDLQAPPDLAHFQVTNGTAGNLTGSGRVFTVEITPSSSNATISLEFLAGQIFDLAGNANDVSNLVTVAFNSNRPVPTLSSSAAAAVNTAAITVNVDFSDVVTGFDVSDLELTNATVSAFAGSGDSYSFALTALSPGPFGVKVKDSAAMDGSSNPSLASNFLSRIYDVTGPVITLSKTESSPTTQQSIVVTLAASEALSGLTLSDFVLTNATGSSLSGSGANFTLTVTATGQGAVDIVLPAGVVTDVAGNASTASNTLSWYYDLFVPSLTITSVQGSPTNVSPLVIQFETNEAVVGFSVGDIAVTNGTLANFTTVDGTHWSAEVTPAAEGDVVISVPAASFQDGAGKDNAAASSTVKFDSVRPTVTLAGLTAYTGTSPVSVTATFSESVTGLALADLVLVNATATLSGSGSSYTVSLTPLAEGPFSVAIAEHAGADGAGNTSTASNVLQSNFDMTPPTAVLESDVGIAAFDSPIPLTIVFSEDVTGLANTDFTVTGGSLSGTISGTGKVYYLTFTPSGTGTKTVQLKASAVTDLGGLANSATSNLLTFYYDTTAVTLSLLEKEQSFVETAGAGRKLTLNASVAKPYPITISYRTLGTAVAGVDHNLGTRGQIVLPAGQTQMDIPFDVTADAGASVGKFLQLNFLFADTPVARFGQVYQSRVFIKDVDGPARPTVLQTSAFNKHRCFVQRQGTDSSGVLRCWGLNTQGQLGDGTQTFRESAVEIDSGVLYQQVSAGGSHTCGITQGGTLKCWGYAYNYQLGNGSNLVKTSPQTIDNGYSAVSAGENTTCGIKAGIVYCWGKNLMLTSGDITTPTAQTIGGTDPFVSVMVGRMHICAINSNQDLYCWGGNDKGQIGDGTSHATNKSSPYLVGTGYVKVVANSYGSNSSYTCGLKATGQIFCWGTGTSGQIGDGAGVDRLVPTEISGAESYKDLSGGTIHVCAVTAAGQVKCWGGNSTGVHQIAGIGDGNSDTGSRKNPSNVADSSVYDSVSAGFNHTCGVLASGGMKCWGEYELGFLGDGTSHARLSPQVSDRGEKYIDVSLSTVSCGVTDLNQLKCWGGTKDVANQFSIGDGGRTMKSSPVVLDRGRKFLKVSTGGSQACAITEDKTLKCWGKVGPNGSMGYTGSSEVPRVVDGNTLYEKISVGSSAICAITVDQVLKCWGSNSYGQMGAGSTAVHVTLPTVVDAGVQYINVAVGDYHVCAITKDQDMKCWGWDYYGSLGRADSVTTGIFTRVTPAMVVGGLKFTDVGVGYGFSCGLATDEKVYCWGDGSNNRTGLGVSTDYATPQLAAGGRLFKALAVGSNNGCAIQKSDSVTYCWGGNSFGHLGSAGTGVYSTSASVATPVDDVETYGRISLGSNGGCGINASGVLKCWGTGISSEIADDSVFHSWFAPVDITHWLFP